MAPLLFTLLVITSVALNVHGNQNKEGWTLDSEYFAPYVASIRYSSDGSQFYHLCTATIIKPKHFLTSASCFDNIDENGKLTVLIGVEDTDDKKAEVINVEKVIIHPEYRREDPLNKFDIALVELERKLKFRMVAQPIRLPTKDSIPLGQGTLDGWNGFTSLKQKTVFTEKLTASVSVLSDDVCSAYYPEKGEAQFCVGGINRVDAPCRGTSGIPFVHKDSRTRPVVVGLASVWTENCEGPALFTSVSPFVDFINDSASGR